MKSQAKLELFFTLDQLEILGQLILGMMNDTKQQFLFLNGEIGSGKTTLVKIIATLLGEKKEIISPTFNKMFIYDNLVHIDAYNMKNQDLKSYEEYFEDKIVIIEWADNLKPKFNEGFNVDIIFVNENKRKYIITWKA